MQTSSKEIFLSALGLHREGRGSEAYELLIKEAEAPDCSSEILQLLGIISGELGRSEEAVRHLRRAVEAAPKSASAHFNLGSTFLIAQRYEEALASFRAALALKPNDAPILAACGDAAGRMARYDEAIVFYRQAIDAAPDRPHAHENLGRVFYKLDRHKDAAKSLQQAIRLGPDNADAIVVLGKTLIRLELIKAAFAAFSHALELAPEHTGALAGLIHCKQKLADWTDYDLYKRRLIECVKQNRISPNPFVLLLIADDPQLHLAGARQAYEFELAKRPVTFPAPLVGKKTLRLAYVSADFRRHPTSYLTAGLYGLHDRQQFEVIGVSLNADDGSAIRKRVVVGFDRFLDMEDQSAETISAELRSMGVDIAIDLMGYTKDTKLGIYYNRAAPIQVGYLGYPGTTGADEMDYIVVDPFIATARVRSNLVEKPVILPDCYQVNDRQRPYPETAPARAEFGLPEKAFVFCAFNNPPKITPDVFHVWMRILAKVKGSVLWLLSNDSAVNANLQKEASVRGIAPDRLVFGKYLDLEDHLARYRLADLFLDTSPYGGHTTVSDALWMGCPAVTCAGESFAARVAGSLLNTIGLPALVTGNFQHYEALAIELARSPKRLSQLRATLDAKRLTTPLFDTERFTHNIERAYREMWRLYQSGEPPRMIDLSANAIDA